jgi:hypothetical protein
MGERMLERLLRLIGSIFARKPIVNLLIGAFCPQINEVFARSSNGKKDHIQQKNMV